MSTSNEGGTRPDTAMSNPSPITTTSAHDTSNRGNRKKSKVAQQGHKVTQCWQKTLFWVPC